MGQQLITVDSDAISRNCQPISTDDLSYKQSLLRKSQNAYMLSILKSTEITIVKYRIPKRSLPQAHTPSQGGLLFHLLFLTPLTPFKSLFMNPVCNI